jgi:two-component system sensor histidine kinase FlrB
MRRVRRDASPQTHYVMLQDLMSRFQSVSQSLERSYAELQERVHLLSAELKKEREERVRLERLAAMGEMAMELAHEIRNPLASIELYASMMHGEYAQQISRSVRLLNHTVSNTLQFGKPISPVPEEMSAAVLLDRVKSFIQPLASRKNIEIELHCQTGCTMTADPELMHRMLLNLILNALRETPTNGTIRLTASATGSDVTLSVEDTGPGIPDATRARIFDPMYSTHREGCGLGLSIVKRIVESHGGSIDVTSSVNGTKFEIRLNHERNMEVVSEPVACSR